MNESEKDSHPNYDIWLHWAITRRCNLNCKYCFDHDKDIKKTGEVPKINIPSLIRTLNKTNKIFKINFVGGGEPFLIPNLIEACKEITKKHYVSFQTNLTSIKIKELCERINPKRVTHIHTSLHIKELERLNLMNRLIENFQLCMERGFNIYAREIAYPPLASEVKEYTKFFKENNIELIFSHFVGVYNGKKYPAAYTKEETKIFGFDYKKSVETHKQTGKLCNAGYNAGIVDTQGNIIRCSKVKENLGNIYQDIKFKDNLFKCSIEFCGCPLKIYDPYLFEKALKENKIL